MFLKLETRQIRHLEYIFIELYLTDEKIEGRYSDFSADRGISSVLVTRNQEVMKVHALLEFL